VICILRVFWIEKIRGTSRCVKALDVRKLINEATRVSCASWGQNSVATDVVIHPGLGETIGLAPPAGHTNRQSKQWAAVRNDATTKESKIKR
jgi:hypothetical protein